MWSGLREGLLQKGTLPGRQGQTVPCVPIMMSSESTSLNKDLRNLKLQDSQRNPDTLYKVIKLYKGLCLFSFYLGPWGKTCTFDKVTENTSNLYALGLFIVLLCILFFYGVVSMYVLLVPSLLPDEPLWVEIPGNESLWNLTVLAPEHTILEKVSVFP